MNINWPKISPSKRGLLAIVALVVVVGTIVLWPSRRRSAQASENRQAAGAPVAAVVKVIRKDLFRRLTIPAEFRPYVEVELHAKVSGYVKDMNVDFGDKVKAGQLLATLEVPELAAELNNAVAMEQKAEANYTNAHLIFSRLAAVNQAHPGLVAQQDLDTAGANDQTAFAAIGGTKADVGKYQTLAGYTNIFAPFDGVVTWRYADPGALIQAGTASDSQSLPLLRVSDNYLLRLDVPVSVDYVQYLHPGDPVDVRVDSLGGKMISEKITRSTDKADEDTRTMMYEIEVPNPNLELAPGMYATVLFKVQNRPNALTIPIGAVGAGNSTVMVVNPNNVVESRPVVLGVETSDEYEVISGLKEGEMVLAGNPRNLQPGQTVQPRAEAGPLDE